MVIIGRGKRRWANIGGMEDGEAEDLDKEKEEEEKDEGG